MDRQSFNKEQCKSISEWYSTYSVELALSMLALFLLGISGIVIYNVEEFHSIVWWIPVLWMTVHTFALGLYNVSWIWRLLASRLKHSRLPQKRQCILFRRLYRLPVHLFMMLMWPTVLMLLFFLVEFFNSLFVYLHLKQSELTIDEEGYPFYFMSIKMVDYRKDGFDYKRHLSQTEISKILNSVRSRTLYNILIIVSAWTSWMMHSRFDDMQSKILFIPTSIPESFLLGAAIRNDLATVQYLITQWGSAINVEELLFYYTQENMMDIETIEWLKLVQKERDIEGEKKDLNIIVAKTGVESKRPRPRL